MTRYNEDLICIPTPLTIAIAPLSSARRSVSTWDPLEYCRTCMNMSLEGDFTLQSCEHSGNTNRQNQKPGLIWSACTTCQQKCGRLPLFGHLAAPLEARNFCACHLWTLRSGWKEPEKQKLSKTFTNWYSFRAMANKNIKECERMMYINLPVLKSVAKHAKKGEKAKECSLIACPIARTIQISSGQYIQAACTAAITNQIWLHPVVCLLSNCGTVRHVAESTGAVLVKGKSCNMQTASPHDLPCWKAFKTSAAYACHDHPVVSW